MLVRTKFNSQRKPSWGKNRLYLNHQVDWKQTAKSYNAIRAIFSVFRMYSTEFDSGCLVCFIEIISCADPQWEIPLYVWLKISALSRSSSCFRPAHPSWSRDLHEYPGLFLGESPPPPPRMPPLHPRPCQHMPCRNSSVSPKNRNFLGYQWESTHDLNPDYW